ncbi:MAG: acetyl-CoA C-acyltransferase [Opitutae bacterium]|nr:acetyl-CoA C-acyltransferase [Opitutae bacterium]
MKEQIHIVGGVRTPFCKAGGDLADKSSADLGVDATKALLARTHLDPGVIDEVIFGCVGQPIDSSNVARVIALRSGIPEEVPAVTTHRNCASGMEAITHAIDLANARRGQVFLVGGTESMSNMPLLFNRRTAGKFARLAKAKGVGRKIAAMARFRTSDFRPQIALRLGLHDPTCNLNMGQTAELLAREFNVSREEQDRFALRSHRLAVASANRLASEIEPSYAKDQKSRFQVVDADVGPREKQSEEALGRLRPVFEKDGTVTPGNASQVTDGAVTLLLATEKACHKHNLMSLGRVVGHCYAGCEPERMGLGPVHAIARSQLELGLSPEDADLVEINEAFAAQVLAVQKAMDSARFCRERLDLPAAIGSVPSEKLNVNGGAIALGHPVGASGARLALTTLKELHRRKAKRGLVSLCVGGGQGGALWLEAA